MSVMVAMLQHSNFSVVQTWFSVVAIDARRIGFSSFTVHYTDVNSAAFFLYFRPFLIIVIFGFNELTSSLARRGHLQEGII